MSSGSALARIDRSGGKLGLRESRLLNISVTGLAFSTDQLFVEGEAHHLLLDLREPLRDLVLVKVRIQWIKRQHKGRWRVGSTFLESSKGWLAEIDSTH